MAHSNRQKLKEGRGGLTRNQARKAQKTTNVSKQNDRLRAVIAWQEENARKKLEKDSPKEQVSKAAIFSKDRRTVKRRKGVIERLEQQLKFGTKTEKGDALRKATVGLDQIPLTESDVKRITKELSTLKNRV